MSPFTIVCWSAPSPSNFHVDVPIISATVNFLFVVALTSYTAKLSVSAGAPKAVKPTISKPTLGIGPSGSTTSIPSLSATTEACTSSMSPDIDAHSYVLGVVAGSISL